MAVLEYVWLDGYPHVKNLRSKIKIEPDMGSLDPSQIPNWGFDGSSTMQAEGSNSDCVLSPVNVVRNPLKNRDYKESYIVLCEVLNPDGSPHESNTRAKMDGCLQ